MGIAPSLRYERELLRGGALRVAGVDEVGRGAIAGPVSVGVVVVDAETRSAPTGLRDSKLLTPKQRQALEPKVARWARECAVGHAGPDEIDRWGIIVGLRLAALRALQQCGRVDSVILDGSHDWLSAESQQLLAAPPWPDVAVATVVTRVRADQRCSSVAAASVAAKVARDRIMRQLDGQWPGYGWAENKGYSTADHGAALRHKGLSQHHRKSWQLAALGEAPAGGRRGTAVPTAEPLPAVHS